MGIITLASKQLLFIDKIAQKIGIKSLTNSLVIDGINLYQKHLSPHKGFSCAYRKLYGTESCSMYFKQIVADQDLAIAIPLFQQRLLDCQTAALTLKNQSDRRRRRSHQNQNYCDCLYWLELPCDLFTCDLLDITDCDICDCDL